MDQAAIVKYCKELGCCTPCCLRYLGLKNPNVYENPAKCILKYQEDTNPSQALTKTDSPSSSNPVKSEPPATDNKDSSIATTATTDKQEPNAAPLVLAGGSPPATTIKQEPETTDIDNIDHANGGSPPAKRRKGEYCVSCIGVLQEDTWGKSFSAVKEVLEKKRYECETFACALSAPIATILREKAVLLRLREKFPEYDANIITPLKEAWKWSFGTKLAQQINKTLDSGAVSPLLITLNIEYVDDLQELEILKTLSPALFESRSQQRRRFTVEFTRRSVEQALDGVTLEALTPLQGDLTVTSPAECVSVACSHSPLYFGGRYIKLSRELPQTPWVLNGTRMMESSVQEIIFEPIAKLYEMPPEDVEHRLKFMSAGREDVDVRCLGDGRPFAIELSDPRRPPTEAELQQICEEISNTGKVVVKSMLIVTKDDLAELKKGEETKCKTYEALCVKLSHSKRDHSTANGDTPIQVTDLDIATMNSAAPLDIVQKTPIRVLHRRPLLARNRKILELEAKKVPDHPQLFTLRIVTEAGTYVKEWVHGSLGRTTPALCDILSADTDILALDVAAVHLNWPNTNKK